MSAGYKWMPLQRTTVMLPPSAALLRVWMEHHGCDEPTARRLMAEDRARTELWRNDLYQVEVRRNPEEHSAHLNIRRLDGAPCIRDWRHFQQIKNELVGPECEAVELYPAESRLTLETWCHEQVGRWEMLRSLKRALARKVVIVHDGRELHFKLPPARLADARVIIERRYPGAVILNGLGDDRAAFATVEDGMAAIAAELRRMTP